MLGAIVSLMLVLAAAYAVTQVGGVITLLFIAALLFLAYRRLSLLAFTVTFTVLLAAYTLLGAPAGIWKGFLSVLLAALWLLNVRPLRKALLTRPFMKTYLKLLPAMSQTEKEALEAGTVWWDGELFTGAPNWPKLLAAKPPQLSAAEQEFVDGPCTTTAPRNRRTTTCRGWHAGRKCRASRSPDRAPARTPVPFPTPGWCAAACGRGARSSD
jgi:hypothetical protein